MYITHPQFAKEPEHYVRAYSLIQKDLLNLFYYIEPSDINLSCYSYRVHALHLRTCIEIEANCKAILAENGYSKGGDWTMADYKKLEKTHYLSGYEVRCPIWSGSKIARLPFDAWRTGTSLPWYQAYNEAKHDRHDKFSRANFGNLLDAVSALVALLSAQFHTFDFSPTGVVLVTGIGGAPAGYETAIGDYFHVRFPENWAEADQYDFDWQSLQNDPDPFQNLVL